MTSPLPGALKIIDEWLANPELWEPWLPSEVETLLTDLREAIVADTRESTPSTLPTDEDREALARELRGPSGAGAMPWAMVADVYPGSADRALAWMEREGFRRSVVSTPSEEVTVAAERAVHRHLSRLSKRDDWAEDDTAVSGQAAFIVRVLTEEGLLASAVSAPPTITDERIAAALRLHQKHYLNSLGMIGEPCLLADNMTGQEQLWCGHCVKPWPCPTVAALGGEA